MGRFEFVGHGVTAAAKQIELNKTQQALKPKLVEANVNPESFLATDYLNHFNEVLMLFEMLPDMPEMLEDVLAWEPLSYADHFARSDLGHQDVIIAAYMNAPHGFRAAFDAKSDELSAAIQTAISEAAMLIEGNDEDRLRMLVETELPEMHNISASLNRIIHGRLPEGMEVVEEVAAASAEDDLAASQAEIDALFD